MSLPTCIVYQDDGRLCRAPATILDHQRGGMVCVDHALDTDHCPTHGVRSRRRDEVRQAQRDEMREHLGDPYPDAWWPDLSEDLP
jgi:hypothetical protein